MWWWVPYRFNAIDLTLMNNATGAYTMVSTVLLTELEAGRRKPSKYELPAHRLCVVVYCHVR